MIEFIKKWYVKNHINKSSCFVFPILPKSILEDGERYETFDFRHQYYRNPEYWYTKYDIKTAQWCAEKDCFVEYGFKYKILTYEEFKPIRKLGRNREEINYSICSYNPCDVNALDLEELKKITFDLSDDNTQSDEIWERLIDYFEKRGLAE